MTSFFICIDYYAGIIDYYQYYLFSVTSIPHVSKRDKGGEDSYYVSDKYIKFYYISILVVADGVGGWNTKGIDPGLYSKELCEK